MQKSGKPSKTVVFDGQEDGDNGLTLADTIAVPLVAISSPYPNADYYFLTFGDFDVHDLSFR